MFVLARTDPDASKHRGITYFLVDMKTPGITVRPIINMVGDHHFNEEYFDNVRVPAENIIGELNRGWYVAMTTLNFEREGTTYTAPSSKASRHAHRAREGRHGAMASKRRFPRPCATVSPRESWRPR